MSKQRETSYLPEALNFWIKCDVTRTNVKWEVFGPAGRFRVCCSFFIGEVLRAPETDCKARQSDEKTLWNDRMGVSDGSQHQVRAFRLCSVWDPGMLLKVQHFKKGTEQWCSLCRVLSVAIKKVNVAFDKFVAILLYFSNSCYRGYGKGKMAACDLQMLTAGNTTVFLCLAAFMSLYKVIFVVCLCQTWFVPASCLPFKGRVTEVLTAHLLFYNFPRDIKWIVPTEPLLCIQV